MLLCSQMHSVTTVLCPQSLSFCFYEIVTLYSYFPIDLNIFILVLPFIYLSIHVLVYTFLAGAVCLSLYLFFCLLGHLCMLTCVYLSIYLTFYLYNKYVYMSVRRSSLPTCMWHLCVYQSTHSYVCFLIFLPFFFVSVYLFFCVSFTLGPKRGHKYKFSNVVN
jgi:hypothetical protein